MASINFFYEEVDFKLQHKKHLKAWISSIIHQQKREIEFINFIFCTDEHLLDINKTYLAHDYYTDIITFDHGESDELPIQSDIFISIDRITDNAQKLNTPFLNELHRVMIHGILHLLGYKDKTEQQKNEMRKREEASLSLLTI